jgi:carboxypeptidase C (cathepsin A)
LICNWLGNRRWVDQLQWEGSQGWSQAQDKAWMVKGQQAGLVTSYDTLSFVKVFQAVSGAGRAAGADFSLDFLLEPRP